jgi:hypothetical protein
MEDNDAQVQKNACLSEYEAEPNQKFSDISAPVYCFNLKFPPALIILLWRKAEKIASQIHR